jgi:UDP-glucose 4-epimerase
MKPLHKKTPIGDFSNIAILCLRYFNPLNGKCLSRDPINEKGCAKCLVYYNNIYVMGKGNAKMGIFGDDTMHKWMKVQ